MSPLSTTQQRVLQALADGKRQDQAAQQEGVDVAVVAAWLADREFRQTLLRTRRRAVEDSVDNLLDDLVAPGKPVGGRRPGRSHRPPFQPSSVSYAEAAESVSLANATRPIVTTLTMFACGGWRRAAMLLPKKNELLSVGAMGEGVDADLVATVPLWKDSTFLHCLQNMRMFRGPLTQDEAHGELVRALGGVRKWPVESFIYPLGARERCYALLYADRLSPDERAPDVGDLVRLCELASVRFVDLMAARRVFAR